MANKSTLEIVVNGNIKGAQNAFSRLGSSIANIGKVAATAAIAGIGALGVGIAIAVKKGVSAASDLQESVNKVGVVFGDTSDEIYYFTQNAATALGLSRQEALEAAGTFGNLFTSMGVGQEASAGMTTELLTLAADLASFNNIDPTVALEKLRAGLVGEVEPLRALGVNLSAAAIESKAVELGLIKQGDELTAAAKSQAAYALIMDQTTNAQGDFARTSKGLANSQRIMQAQLKDVTAQFGESFLPVIEKLANFVVENVMPALIGFAEVAGPWLADKMSAFIDWAENVLVPFVQNVLYPWFKEKLPIAIKILSDFWTNTLQPAIQAVWNWMSTVLIPFLVNQVYPWLQENIPKALQTLSDFWTNILRPAIETVWNWMSTVLIPFLRDTVYPWLQDNIPKAIETLSGFWEDTLLPAINAVWEFIDTYLMPIFELVKEIVEIGLPLAITALQGAWENVLKPALDIIWSFVEEKLTPALTWLMDEVITPLAASIKEGLASAVDWVVEKLTAFRDMLRNIKLPDWLIPGSPTPFEIGLRGIADALGDLNRMRLPQFAANISSLNAPGIVSGMAPAFAAAPYGGDTIINMTITDSGAAALAFAEIDQMRRGRLNAGMGG